MSIYHYLLPGRGGENVNVPIHKWTLVNLHSLSYFSLLIHVNLIKILFIFICVLIFDIFALCTVIKN